MKPPAIVGLRHIALTVKDLEGCARFYALLGYETEWQPDDDNLYLTSGSDNLALHRTHNAPTGGALDHIGVVVRRADDVDAWHRFLSQHGVAIEVPPKTHRDGARSFYCRDPAGNLVQLIYHPPICGT